MFGVVHRPEAEVGRVLGATAVDSTHRAKTAGLAARVGGAHGACEW